MDWLSIYQAKMDCYVRVVILKILIREEVGFIGERNVVFNGLVSMMTTRKLMKKGCEAFLAYVEDI
jgi:hypothetical protein